MEQRRRRLKRTIDYRGRDWFRQYEQLAYSRPHHVLLESGQGGRYSIIGLDPIGVIRADERRLIIKQRGLKRCWMARRSKGSGNGFGVSPCRMRGSRCLAKAG
nr:hypothetical protein [Geobacillus thermoleovorans]